MTALVDVARASAAEKPAIARLLELYAHDFSEFNGADVDDAGLYGYRYLDAYWLEPERHPFLIRVDGRIAGFALVRAVPHWDMAEFFVMRKYRRGGIGRRAARSVFAAFPGNWQVRQLSANTGAIAFWRGAIPVPFEEGANDEGPVQTFRIPAAEQSHLETA